MHIYIKDGTRETAPLIWRGSRSSVKDHHRILLIWKMTQYMWSELHWCGTSTCTRPGRETTFSGHVGFTICFISTIQEFMGTHILRQQSHIYWRTILCSGQVLTMHVGFGLLGEHGDESIHAKFNRLGRIKDHMQNLMCKVKEHLRSIESQLVAAIPPPAMRVKNT